VKSHTAYPTFNTPQRRELIRVAEEVCSKAPGIKAMAA
jgi:hypothetical protein